LSWLRLSCYNFGCSGDSSSGRTADSESKFKTELLTNFLNSRKEGTAPGTKRFYKGNLNHSLSVIGLQITHDHINSFLASLKCSLGGKHAYYRTLRAFYKWFYSPKSGYGLDFQSNPMLLVDAPKPAKRILPSVTEEQLAYLISKSEDSRDKVVIHLLFDSGMRLNEITNVKCDDIDWDNKTISVIGKGNKQRKVPFTTKTGDLLKTYVNGSQQNCNIWGLSHYGISQMLERLEKKTGIKCNPHSFRRGFACNLHKKGLSTLDIMHLGGWSDLSMVLRYTQSITFDDCLKHYREIEVH
jgi:site-specific recombinase XerD